MSPSSVLRPLSVIAVMVILQGASAGAEDTKTPLSVLADASEHGLPETTDSSVSLQKSLLGYAQAQHGGRIEPAKVDAEWALDPEPFDAEKGLREAEASGDLTAWLAALPPPYEGYRALVSARRRYAALARAGGWGALPPLGLKPGSVGSGVLALRRRLDAEGYSSMASRSPATFDSGLEQALRRFERNHDLPVNGVVTKGVHDALAISPAVDLATIDANLERWRWLPRALSPDRIEVNIAAAELTLFHQGEAMMTMRTIVGDIGHHTPMFATTTTAIVINPPWVVPTSIAKAELYPKEARRPGYFAANGFSRVNGELRQAAGPKSALGRVKIDLDDPYSIYLHDTPQRGYFARENRAMSHGCVRLERPVDLAAALLSPQQVSRKNIEGIIAAGATKRINLTTRTPVFFLYRTAVANEDGTVSFHPDVYGWDAELNAALSQLSFAPS